MAPNPPVTAVAADPPKSDWINVALIVLVIGLAAYAKFLLGFPAAGILVTVSAVSFASATVNLAMKNLVYAAFWLAAGFFLPAGAVIALL